MTKVLTEDRVAIESSSEEREPHDFAPGMILTVTPNVVLKTYGAVNEPRIIGTEYPSATQFVVLSKQKTLPWQDVEGALPLKGPYIFVLVAKLTPGDGGCEVSQEMGLVLTQTKTQSALNQRFYSTERITEDRLLEIKGFLGLDRPTDEK